MNRLETDIRASSGHSWNQSMDVQLTTPGNFLPLTLNVLPTGEKHSTTFSIRRTRSMKNLQQLSRVSSSPWPLTSLRTPLMQFSTSSSGSRSGISPVDRRSLTRTRNFSSVTYIRIWKLRLNKPSFTILFCWGSLQRESEACDPAATVENSWTFILIMMHQRHWVKLKPCISDSLNYFTPLLIAFYYPWKNPDPYP